MKPYESLIRFISVSFFLVFMVSHGIPISAEAGEVTIERFLYKHISDVATLSDGMRELDLHFYLEGWGDVNVFRTALTYRMGLSERAEAGVHLMHSWIGPLERWSYGGFNDTTLYAKYALLKAGPETRSPVDVSIGGKVFAPTGSESKGFGIGEWYSGEFIAFSKPFDAWTVHADVGRINTDATGWRNYYYWGTGCMYSFETESGPSAVSLEITGAEKTRSWRGDSLESTMAFHFIDPQDPDVVGQVGLTIPMDGSNQDWEIVFSCGFSI